MTKLAIITVSYNSASVIDLFVQALLAQDYLQWQLYLVDSASTDSTLQQVVAYTDSRIRLLSQTENVGFARGNNIGVAQAILDGCNELLLINNDTEFESDFLGRLLKLRSSYPNSVLTPKIYFPDNKIIWAAGGGFKPQLAWSPYHIGENQLDTGQYDADYVCEFAPMCCVLISTQTWNKVSLLDEKYFIYSEDADWFYRAKQLNIVLMYSGSISLIHKVSSLTGGATSKIGASYGTRNRIYFICKHFSGVKRLEYLFKYAIGMLVALITGKYSWQEFKWRVPAFWRGLRL